METISGTLYGIGVGPGDPELMTLKAVRILSRVDMVFTAASTKNDYSLAVTIAQAHIPEQTPVRSLAFPMTQNAQETSRAWADHARTLVAELETGKNLAFLTLGDPLTYSTFGYILKNIREIAPHIPVETVPGITSYQAAAARLNTPLVEGEEALLLVSGVQGGDRLRQCGGKPENVVFLKAYRNVPDIALALEEAQMLTNSVGVVRCGQEDEEIIRDLRAFTDRPPGYWTLIIAKQGEEKTKT